MGNVGLASDASCVYYVVTTECRVEAKIPALRIGHQGRGESAVQPATGDRDDLGGRFLRYL
jgi:hypothetical protein